MATAVQKQMILGSDLTVTLRLEEFPEGTPLRIVITEDEASMNEDTTDYLLAHPANKLRLIEAVEAARDPKNLVEMDPGKL